MCYFLTIKNQRFTVAFFYHGFNYFLKYFQNNIFSCTFAAIDNQISSIKQPNFYGLLTIQN